SARVQQRVTGLIAFRGSGASHGKPIVPSVPVSSRRREEDFCARKSEDRLCDFPKFSRNDCRSQRDLHTARTGFRAAETSTRQLHFPSPEPRSAKRPSSPIRINPQNRTIASPDSTSGLSQNAGQGFGTTMDWLRTIVGTQFRLVLTKICFCGELCGSARCTTFVRRKS